MAYVQELAASEEEEEREEAREGMRKWAGVLLANEAEETTKVLVEVCCGPEKKEKVVTNGEEQPNGRNGGKGRIADLKEAKTNGSSGGYDVPGTSSSSVPPPSSSGSPTFSPRASFAGDVPTADTAARAEPDLPSPRIFFPHFVDHPLQFIAFLEAIALRRYGQSVDSLVIPSNSTGSAAPLPDPKPFEDEEPEEYFDDPKKRDEAVVWNTLLELYVSPVGATSSTADAEREQKQRQRQAKGLKLLRAREQVPYDATQALLVCTTQGFEEGFVCLYEMEGRYEEIVRCK